MSVLTIKDWDRTFHLEESLRHSEVTWVKFPTRTDSLAYKRLMRTREGRDAYCVFVACVQRCARSRSRGKLSAGGSPITHRDLADSTGLPLKVVSASIEILQSPDIGWLIPAPEPGNKRAENGPQPFAERSENGQQPFGERAGNGLAHAAAKSRGRTAAVMQQQATDTPGEGAGVDAAAAQDSQRGEICSLLLGLRHLGSHVFDRAAAAAIARHPNVSRMQVAWVLERMNAMGSKEFTSGPAAYVRAMLTEQRPPRGWVESYRRRELAALAAKESKQ